MAENKRIYEIRINGLQESYDGVQSLREALDSLTDTVVNVSKEEEKTVQTRKSTSTATDQLAKAQEKLNNWDKEYQTQLAETNAQLSSNKKEINATIKVQQAQEVVEAKQLDTYAQKQQYLSALNTLIRNHSTATEEDRAAIDGMVRESAALQAELKATDEQMKIYVRNVGNYPGAAQMVVESHKSLKQELKELKAEMAEMLASGVSKTDEAYLKLAERAGQLKDAMSDANQDITNFASDTRGLTNAINLASSAVSAYQLYNSALQVFGDENEEAAKSIQKMMSVMTLLNSLQTVQNNLLENGSATARLYTKAVELVQAALGIKKTAVEENIAVTEAATVAEETNTVAQEMNATASEANATSTGIATTAETTNTGAITANTTATEANTVATNSMSVAQKAGAVASNILSVALRAIPLMAIIGLVITLIQNWQSIWNWFKKTFPVLDTLSNKFNKFGGFMKTVKAIAKGLGEGIINWLVNPFKTLGNVIGKILKGDFEGAAKAAIDGVKQQFKGFSDSINKELNDAAISATEERVKKQKEKEHELTEYQLQELMARKGNEAKYSKEGIALQQKEFAQRKALAKGNADELKKIHLEEVSFYRECEEQKTKASEKGAKARAAAASKAAAEAKKASEEAQKAAEQYEKKIKKLVEDSQKLVEEGQKLDSSRKKTILKGEQDAAKVMQQTSITAAQETLKQLNVVNSAIEKTEKAIDEAKTMVKSYEEEFEKTGDATAEASLKQWKKTLAEQEQDLLILGQRQTNLNEQYKKDMTDIATANGKLKQTFMQTLADEAIELKLTYLKQIDKISDKIWEVEDEWRAALAKGEKATADNLEKEIYKMLDQLYSLETGMKDLFGKYADETIVIPVDIKVDKIIERVNELKSKLPNGGELLFNETQVVDMIFGFGDKIDQLFKTLAENKSLHEIAGQFEYWVKNAELTETQLMSIQKILNSGLPIEDIKNQLMNYADALGVSQQEMAEVFEYYDKMSVKNEKLVETFKQVGYAVGLSEEQLAKLEEIFNSGLGIDKTKEKVQELISNGTVSLKKFGAFAEETKKSFTDTNKSLDDQLKKSIADYISYYDKQIKTAENNIKRFQDATKDIKFEPVTDNSKYYDTHLVKLKQTRERYAKLKAAYLEYQESIQTGSESMQKYEEAWQRKLEATKALYTENSDEYRSAVEEKKKTDAAYAIEREKVTQQIEDLDRKEHQLWGDGIEALVGRMGEIYKILDENVFGPIAEGLSDLFAFQLEEAKDALEEIEELYDKAVEAREESAERMKEINDELRADDGQNKEALQQRLAEEEVLLVQREEQERALQKEKEKREQEVEKKEKQQRKLELSQKLIEGIANTALGATAALKYGFPMGPIFAAIITAFGALQTALIAKQISKLEKGGKVGEKGISRSHKQGGHRIEDTNIEVEGGEWVINKKSSQKYDTVLRAINEDNVNLVNKQIEIIKEKRVTRENVVRKFASGGQINTLTATKAVKENNQIEAITDLIRQIDFQPTVAVTDINKVNKNLVRVQQYAGKSA